MEETKGREINIALRLKIVEKFRTNQRFAEAVEMTNATVSNVINGLQSPRRSTKKMWATTLGCQVEEIFPIKTAP